VAEIRAAMPELPGALAERLQREHGLPAYDAAMMTATRATAEYFRVATEGCGQPKLVANWVMGEITKRLNAEGTDIAIANVGPTTLAALIRRIHDGTISNNAARQVFETLWSKPIGGVSPKTSGLELVDALIDSLGLRQMSDSSALEAIIAEVLAANQKSVDEFRAGKDKAFNALVGQVMKASKGKANPAQVNELLKRALG
jgi:aspartyl-tRNA(Asn)/glutamyl-tRNA(Gln) amidotransferase subunit B